MGSNVGDRFNNESKVENDFDDPLLSKTTDCTFKQHINSKLRAVTVRAPVSIGGMDIWAVVDTGAEVTVMGKKFYESIPDVMRPALRRSCRNLVVAEEGRELAASGIVEFDITLGEQQFRWPVYVASIADDLLLGCDIIDDLNLTVNTKSGLEMNGKWISCDVSRRSEEICRVILKETITIPARCEFFTTGMVKNLRQIKTRYAVLEPLVNDDEAHHVIARVMVDPFAGCIPVRLVNTSDKVLKLEKGLGLGELQEASEVLCDLGDSELGNSLSSHCNHPMMEVTDSAIVRRTFPILRINQKKEDNWIQHIPEHLKDLYKQTCKSLEYDTQRERFAKVLLKHADAFALNKTDLGSCSLVQHKIDTAGAAPVRQPVRRTPKGFEEEEKQYLKEQLEAGIVVPSKSCWASPVVLVRKKDQTVRWCVDYRRLNERTVKDAYPLPRIDMCLDCLGGARWFSMLDLQSGYWQLTLDQKDQHKTAFITKYGLYEYTKLPFGLCNAPSTFQRCMELVLRGLQWQTLLIYLDDIIIHSMTIEEHFQRLEEVLKRLSEAGLKLKPSKCQLLKPEVLFLGHVVGRDGIRPNPQLVEAVQKWKVPENVKECQQFMGLCNYYRRFIYKFSDIASPITQLTKKNIDFHWSTECQQAFDKLKIVLCSTPILGYPQKEGIFIVDTDASNIGIGAVLSQVQMGEERVLCYASKKLDKSQQRYCVTRRELLAVVTFINQFRHYLLGKEFHLRTDHGSLRWLFSFKDPQGQMARWLEVLSQYNFRVFHREGKKHQNADAMSRQYNKEDLCYHYRKDTPVNELPCGGCNKCKKMSQEWSSFNEEVDNIIPLSKQPSEQDVTFVSPGCRRMLTRNAAKLDLHSRNAKQVNQSDAVEYSPLCPNWLDGYDSIQISQLQKDDVYLRTLHTWFENGGPPNREEAASHSPAIRHFWLNWENIILENGVLYQIWRASEKGMPERRQLLIPATLRREVIQQCHDSIMSAHLGIEKTVEKIKQRFYWYRLGADVKAHIKECPVCCANRHPKKRLRAALKDYRVGYPLDRIALDIMGPLPKPRQGNNNLLVIGDYFTRWVEAYPIPDQQAATVAEKLVKEFISRFGAPLEIHTDQGRNFQSDLFREICHLLEVKQTRTTPYHPSSNGLIERFNRTLAQMIRSFIADNQLDWDVHVPLLTSAYRSTVHPATGFTPNYLMFGREVNIPVDVLFPRPGNDEPKEIHVHGISLLMYFFLDLEMMNLKRFMYMYLK